MELISFLFRVAIFTLLAATPPVHASADVIVPWNMTADEVYDLRVQSVDPDSSVRQRANAYRIYLALTPPGWGTGPVCWLAYQVDIDTTQVNISIPADVAPDKSRVRFSSSFMKKGAARTQGFSYSATTRLLGANGTWSQRELDGWVIGSADEISCWAYGCARSCEDQYYTGDKTRSSDGTSDRKANACVKKCAKTLNPQGAAASIMSMPSLLVVGVIIGAVHLIADTF
ncbi:hypothetical protein BKA59DRAFT_479017 [Fusarium tricinctum]|jgi:hypothetical protein|uniref:Uncharacterized protein n=1 Tax=Fusarium tricinctum TaxID=61284 RepID=A0A8K0W9L0_9HYPO|nr:hypothetical protein BKA59DRAFT_479017 [Fusarium tricinctum]